MPRVTTHTASDRGRTYTCTGCGQPIEAGQAYYRWVRRVGPKAGYRRHVTCGPPRPSELTSRKTAQVEEAVQDYSAPSVDLAVLDKVAAEDTLELDAGDFESAVDGVASTAEEVADEYEGSADNMPENLQSSYQAEAMREVADRLREWAEELRDKASEDITVDLPDPEDYKDEDSGEYDTDEWRDAAEQAVQEAWDERASELDDMMGDMPEYEG